jgi:hypothetical protein
MKRLPLALMSILEWNAFVVFVFLAIINIFRGSEYIYYFWFFSAIVLLRLMIYFFEVYNDFRENRTTKSILGARILLLMSGLILTVISLMVP